MPNKDINLSYHKYDYSKKENTAHANTIKKMVRKCMNHLKKKEYELNITSKDVDRAVAVTKVVNYKSAGATNACASSIQINLSYWQHLDEEHFHTEYKSYNNDPQIGGRKCLNLDHAYLMSVSHEVSHHVQFARAKYVNRFKTTYRKPHGDCFKAIYRYLRRDLVNPIIEKDILEKNQPKQSVIEETIMQKNKVTISSDIKKQMASQEAQHTLLKGSNKAQSEAMSAIRVDQYAEGVVIVHALPRTDTGNLLEDHSNEILTILEAEIGMSRTQAELFKRNITLFSNKHKADMPSSNLTKTFVLDLFAKLDLKSQAKILAHNKGDDVKTPLDTIIDKLVGLKTKTGKQRDGLIMTQSELDDFKVRLINRFEIAEKGRKAIDEAEEEQSVVDDVTEALLA
tara:strand:+ start:1564 stop:2757 length:1194 start_codon:yes stop_codon:yes gene_type:complete